MGIGTGFLWSLAGNAAYAGGQWLTIVAIARLGGATMLGQYTLGLAITAPVVLLAGMSLRTVLVTDHDQRNRLVDYLSLRLLCMLLAAGAVAIFSWRLEESSRAVLLIVCLAKGVDGVGDILIGVFQKAGAVRRIAHSQILNGVLTAGLVSLLLWSSGSIQVASCGSLAASILSSVGYCAWTLRGESFRRAAAKPPRRISRLALSAAPLGVAASVSSFTANAPRYFLGSHASMETLGVFSAITYPASIIGIAAGAFAQNLLPRLSLLAAGQGSAPSRRLVIRLLFSILTLAVTATAVAALTAGPLLTLTYGEQYAAFAGESVLLISAAAFGAAGYVLDCALAVIARFREQLIANLLSLVTSVAVSILAIPRMGVTGASLAVAAATLVLLTVKTLMFLSFCTPDRDPKRLAVG